MEGFDARLSLLIPMMIILFSVRGGADWKERKALAIKLHFGNIAGLKQYGYCFISFVSSFDAVFQNVC